LKEDWKESKWYFSGNDTTEHRSFVARNLKKYTLSKMLEDIQRAHISYFNKKINQMIIVINECIYEKDFRILRFDLLEHLQVLIETQEKNMAGIYSSYKTPTEEQDDKYAYSILRPFHQILENVIIKDHGPMIKAENKVKSVRYLLRLQWGVNNNRITGNINYKMFLDSLNVDKLEHEHYY
jgi:hypothetical protein